MAIYPVIMCGGAGTRLWPASRPSRPKQFIPLSGNRSLFQETVLRVAPLASDDGGRLIVVGGVGHRTAILEQLEEVGVEAQILLEPEARDSAAAMAAAAAWTDKRDREGINIFVASDHHIPDADAFRSAAAKAAEAARGGRIVTLGVRPTEPSSAYGYIAPEGAGLSAVRAFVEKPDAETAERYIEAGYLWNSGNFIVAASTLLEEVKATAPAVEHAVQRAVPTDGAESPTVLGDAFVEAPKISIDYAVMEKTSRASVLAVDFEWSDLGAWDSVAATGDGDLGVYVFEDAENCLARAPDGMMVAAIGVRNLAIVAERDAVLVCDLSRGQDVKKVVERLKIAAPQFVDFPSPPQESFEDASERFTDWMRMQALPLWSALGQSPDGAFAELLGLDGRQVASQRRARVQARQTYVFAEACRQGWRGASRDIITKGLESLERTYLRPDGLMRTLLAADGTALDETPMLYDQAFLMLALASASAAGLEGDLAAQAATVRDRLLAGTTSGGLIENGAHPHQSNAHMHLLEAALAWEEQAPTPEWRALTDRIVALAKERFIDPEGGFLREFFKADWTPADGPDGDLVEPGHQFEWAWLMTRHGRMRDDASSIEAARRLYANGMKGIGPRRRVALDALSADGSARSRRARLWPQTEWLKASLILAELAADGDRDRLLANAAEALRALWRYLTPEGAWKDKLLEGGDFIDEPAPASSLYHIVAAWIQLKQTGQALNLRGAEHLELA